MTLATPVRTIHPEINAEDSPAAALRDAAVPHVDADPSIERPTRTPWAALLHRTFDVLVLCVVRAAVAAGTGSPRSHAVTH